MNGCTGLCCPGGAQAARRIVAGSGSVAGLEGAAGTVCRLEPRSEWLLGSSGDSGAHGVDGAVSVSRWPELTGALRARGLVLPSDRLARPGRQGGVGPPSPVPPGLAVVLGQLCSFPPLLVLVLLVLVFIPFLSRFYPVSCAGP